MIKGLVLLFAATAVLGDATPTPNANAEADPWLLYGGYGGYGLGYYGLGLGYYGYPYVYYGRKKRSAEAEPSPVANPDANPEAKADPWLLYGGYYGHGLGYYGHGLGYYGYPYVYYGRKKRSAEAEPSPVANPDANPEAEADPWLLYGGYYGHGLGYYGHGLGYYGYPYVYYGRKKRSAEAEPSPVANPDADPEAKADPWLLYGGYYGHGLGYYGHGLGYYGYPYVYYGRKKRSAEAEAEPTADAKADPWLLYGHGYGYYGHHLGYYGHPYGYYWG